LTARRFEYSAGITAPAPQGGYGAAFIAVLTSRFQVLSPGAVPLPRFDRLSHALYNPILAGLGRHERAIRMPDPVERRIQIRTRLECIVGDFDPLPGLSCRNGKAGSSDALHGVFAQRMA
jgi:hypothetical protein